MLTYLIVFSLVLCAMVPPAAVHEHRICLYALYIAIMYIMIQIYIHADKNDKIGYETRLMRGGEL
jgi:hypothetical protein